MVILHILPNKFTDFLSPVTFVRRATQIWLSANGFREMYSKSFRRFHLCSGNNLVRRNGELGMGRSEPTDIMERDPDSNGML